jgi:outer membrane receptor protein involved in Fe transport
MNVNYKNNYLNFFPTAHVKYEFSERNAFMLSYSRRVNRPGSRTLNPFVNTEDPMNLTAGNPYLKPEFTNAFELSHLIDFKSTSIGTTLFYRETDNIIGNVMTLLDSGVTYTTYQNLDRESSYGAELVLSQKIFKWWKMNGSFSFFGLKYKGDGQVEIYNDYNYSWNAKVFSTMTFWKSFDVQLSFYYSSPVISTQGKENMRFTTGGGIGRQKANFYFDAGLKKDFFKGKLSLSLRLSDVLKTIQFDLQTQGSNFNSTLSRTRESRVVYFGVSYKINGGLKQKKRKAEDNNVDFEY